MQQKAKSLIVPEFQCKYSLNFSYIDHKIISLYKLKTM